MELDRGAVELLPLDELIVPRTLLSLYVACVAFIAGGMLISVFLELSASRNCTPLVALRVYRLSAAKGTPAYAAVNFGAVFLGLVNLTANHSVLLKGPLLWSVVTCAIVLVLNVVLFRRASTSLMRLEDSYSDEHVSILLRRFKRAQLARLVLLWTALCLSLAAIAR